MAQGTGESHPREAPGVYTLIIDVTSVSSLASARQLAPDSVLPLSPQAWLPVLAFLTLAAQTLGPNYHLSGIWTLEFCAKTLSTRNA